MLKYIKKLIKQQDQVGHAVHFSYNGKGNLHQTFLGGLISSFVLTFILGVSISKTKTMITHGDDTLTRIT